MYKIGVSSGKRLFDAEIFSLLKKSNIDAIEISVPYDMHDMIEHKKIKKMSEDYHIELWSYHLPFVPFSKIEPSSLDKNIREYTVKYFTELIQKASDIGINKLVVHSSGEPIDDSERDERMKCAMETLDILADVAHRCGGVIAVENLPRTCLGKNSDEIKRLIGCNDKLRVCFDTNHLLAENYVDFIKKVNKNIITLHVSDYDFIDERHWLPGEGSIDWYSLADELSKVDYKGVWMYEVRMITPSDSIRERDLTYADIFENARTILNKEKIKVIGKPTLNN